jgi:hypothetical protein
MRISDDRFEWLVAIIATLGLIFFIFGILLPDGKSINPDILNDAPPADTSLITFTAKPSDKLLIAVWDSELNAYRSFTSRADSVANGLGTILIHKEDQP